MADSLLVSSPSFTHPQNWLANSPAASTRVISPEWGKPVIKKSRDGLTAWMCVSERGGQEFIGYGPTPWFAYKGWHGLMEWGDRQEMTRPRGFLAKIAEWWRS